MKTWNNVKKYSYRCTSHIIYVFCRQRSNEKQTFSMKRVTMKCLTWIILTHQGHFPIRKFSRDKFFSSYYTFFILKCIFWDIGKYMVVLAWIAHLGHADVTLIFFLLFMSIRFRLFHIAKVGYKSLWTSVLWNCAACNLQSCKVWNITQWRFSEFRAFSTNTCFGISGSRCTYWYLFYSDL